MGRSDRLTVRDVDDKITAHERQCLQRYDQIMDAIDNIRTHISILHSRAWGALTALIGTLVVVCFGLVAFIFTRMPH